MSIANFVVRDSAGRVIRGGAIEESMVAAQAGPGETAEIATATAAAELDAAAKRVRDQVAQFKADPLAVLVEALKAKGIISDSDLVAARQRLTNSNSS